MKAFSVLHLSISRYIYVNYNLIIGCAILITNGENYFTWSRYLVVIFPKYRSRNILLFLGSEIPSPNSLTTKSCIKEE